MKTIATDKLNIEKLKECFANQPIFETKDLIEFYRKLEPDIKATSINWRVYRLVNIGTISRIGKGKFTIKKVKFYLPEISSRIKNIHAKLKKKFPHLRVCLWNTSSFNEFMIHQPGRFYLLIEAEANAAESVFFFLKEANYPVFLDPTSDIINKYLPPDKETLIIKSLVSGAPTQNIQRILTTTIEKMLVDIFCDDVIFSAQQGSEMRIIFTEAFSKYSINKNRMLRYADRRRKKESFNNYLTTIPNYIL
ncbi:MAG: hypothetical protein P4L27_14985 [Ignavibacteriaceae bacterium]|nr:hypothetical protein [Ignavibacteriaceae bacterium]